MKARAIGCNGMLPPTGLMSLDCRAHACTLRNRLAVWHQEMSHFLRLKPSIKSHDLNYHTPAHSGLKLQQCL